VSLLDITQRNHRRAQGEEGGVHPALLTGCPSGQTSFFGW
jgi:hypothetical protein